MGGDFFSVDGIFWTNKEIACIVGVACVISPGLQTRCRCARPKFEDIRYGEVSTYTSENDFIDCSSPLISLRMGHTYGGSNLEPIRQEGNNTDDSQRFNKNNEKSRLSVECPEPHQNLIISQNDTQKIQKQNTDIMSKDNGRNKASNSKYLNPS
ncbi:unnamed protein product [Thelazia callipaeda]|uniref:Uncharacterized protein n=1 Tax=Thelazia callipaeda TaxID=103827 RepID=A0A0N5CME3_THECL|nr:unnamed protein product [Thelazia callipaeda]